MSKPAHQTQAAVEALARARADHPHRWAYIRACATDEDGARRFLETGHATFDDAADLQVVCLGCHQPFNDSTADLPCPERVYLDRNAPRKMAVALGGRTARRQTAIKDRRAARKGQKAPTYQNPWDGVPGTDLPHPSEALRDMMGRR